MPLTGRPLFGHVASVRSRLLAPVGTNVTYAMPNDPSRAERLGIRVSSASSSASGGVRVAAVQEVTFDSDGVRCAADMYWPDDG